jgi:ribonuclease BN (tRNA processing enzyme)
MRLTVVGCAGSYPGPDSPASCYLIEYEGHRLVLDLGSGSFGALQRQVDVLDDDGIEGVVLSHLHADHCLDMCAMHVARSYRPSGPMPRIPVLAPVGAEGRLARAGGMPEDAMTSRFEFLSHREGGVTDIGPFRITSRRVVHPVEAYAVRVEAGDHSVAYSGDTGACQALIDIARDADIGLFEASWSEPAVGEPARPIDLHLSGREAGQHARRASVGTLVLTHVVPWADERAIEQEAREVFDGTVVMARSGLVIEPS